MTEQNGESQDASLPDNSGSSLSQKLLSCKRCRYRKVKCDRQNPCSACQKLDVECAYPDRGRVRKKYRSSKRDNELLHRLARLEELVATSSGRVGTHSAALYQDTNEGNQPLSGDLASNITSRVQGIWLSDGDRVYPDLGPHKSTEAHLSSNQFWSSLTTEVDGLRQLLDEPSDDEESASQSLLGLPEHSNLSPASNLIFNLPAGYVDLRSRHPRHTHAAILCDIYFYRIDPLFKILHRPTIRSSILAAADIIASVSPPKPLEALMFAIYFAAITSMSNQECIKDFGQSKDVLIARYEYATQTALVNADFLDDIDFVTLQAFLIFLLCYRLGRGKRLAWVLLSIAIRQAHILGLHREGSVTSFTPFETEMRRRLWWKLCTQDIWQAEDYESDPIIYDFSFNTAPPSNVNDEDLDPNDLRPIVGKSKATDMAFSMISHASYLIQSQLGYSPPGSQRSNAPPLSFSDKQAIAEQCRIRLEEYLLQTSNHENPFCQMSAIVGRMVLMKLFVLLRFPVQKLPEGRPILNTEQVFDCAVTILELAEFLETNPQFFQWQWHIGTWIQWHPLAVTLAGLCKQTRGPIVQRAWAVVERTYVKYSERVSDAKKRVMWRPLKKLYQKAKATWETANGFGAQMSTQTGYQTGDFERQSIDSSAVIRTDEISNVGIARKVLAGPIIPFDMEQPFGLFNHPLDNSQSKAPTTVFDDIADWDEWNQFIQDSDVVNGNLETDNSADL